MGMSFFCGEKEVTTMKKKQGVLIYDEGAVCYNIRFDLNDYYGGLHCGECLDAVSYTHLTLPTIA